MIEHTGEGTVTSPIGQEDVSYLLQCGASEAGHEKTSLIVGLLLVAKVGVRGKRDKTLTSDAVSQSYDEAPTARLSDNILGVARLGSHSGVVVVSVVRLAQRCL